MNEINQKLTVTVNVVALSLILDESKLFPDVDDEYESSSSLSLFAQDVINKMLIVRMNKFFIFSIRLWVSYQFIRSWKRKVHDISKYTFKISVVLG